MTPEEMEKKDTSDASFGCAMLLTVWLIIITGFIMHFRLNEYTAIYGHVKISVWGLEKIPDPKALDSIQVGGHLTLRMYDREQTDDSAED